LQWEKSVFSIFSIGETDTALIRYQAHEVLFLRFRFTGRT
jgi:hypothetical protein